MSTQSHTQKPNDMFDTSRTMKSPNHATNLPEPPISTPPIYLPLWRQSTKKDGWSKLVLGQRRLSRKTRARSGDVVADVIVVGRIGIGTLGRRGRRGS